MTESDSPGAALGMFKAFKPSSLVSSFSAWNEFGGLAKKLALALLMIANMAALPVQLMLHRRLGERFVNVITLGIATLGYMLVLGSRVGRYRDGWETHWWETMGNGVASLILLVGIPLFYLDHRYQTRRREMSGDHVHSFSWGVPFYLFGFRKPRGDANPPSVQPLPSYDPTAPFSAQIWQEWQTSWQEIMADRAAGRPPSGQVPWLIVTVVEPLVILAVGLILFSQGGTVGLLLTIAGVGILVQGSIINSQFRSKLLDYRDAGIEQETWAAAIRGRRAATEHRGFVVPVSSRHIPPAVHETLAERLTKSDPSVARLVQPPNEPEVKTMSNGPSPRLAGTRIDE